MNRDRQLLLHISRSIDLIRSYVADEAGELIAKRFFDDQRTQDAVLRRLETLADAANHLSPELKTRHSNIEWRKIADFRNILAHAYLQIRLEPVWEIVSRDLEPLRQIVEMELAETDTI